MTRPLRIAAYPASMLTAFDRAIAEGEFIIPTEKPGALRLTFAGLIGAMRAEGKTERCDMVSLITRKDPPALILRLKEKNPLMLDLAAALAENPPLPASMENENLDAALKRILGN